MAFSTKIECRDPRGRALWTLDQISWWPDRELIRDERFEGRFDGGYMDYVAQLSVDEARELERAYRDKGECQSPTRANELFEKLATADASQRIVVAIYEWESGF